MCPLATRNLDNTSQGNNEHAAESITQTQRNWYGFEWRRIVRRNAKNLPFFVDNYIVSIRPRKTFRSKITNEIKFVWENSAATTKSNNIVYVRKDKF